MPGTVGHPRISTQEFQRIGQEAERLPVSVALEGVLRGPLEILHRARPVATANEVSGQLGRPLGRTSAEAGFQAGTDGPVQPRSPCGRHPVVEDL